jgi:archaellum component FlaC
VDTNTLFVDATANSVGIGTITPVQAFQIDSTTKGFLPPRMTTTQKNLIPQTPGTMVFDTTLNSLSVRNNTAWVSVGAPTGFFAEAKIISPSDERLKKNIKSLDLDVFDVLDRLNPVSFEWKDQVKGNLGTQFGFVAQEVEKVLPNLVITSNDGRKGVDEIEMIPILMDAIKKQQKQIAELQKKIEELKN